MPVSGTCRACGRQEGGTWPSAFRLRISWCSLGEGAIPAIRCGCLHLALIDWGFSKSETPSHARTQAGDARVRAVAQRPSRRLLGLLQPCRRITCRSKLNKKKKKRKKKPPPLTTCSLTWRRCPIRRRCAQVTRYRDGRDLVILRRLLQLSSSPFQAFVEISGLSPNSRDIIDAGYRSPLEPPTLSMAWRMPRSSSLLRCTFAAPALSSRYLMRFVPGIGMKSSLETSQQLNPIIVVNEPTLVP